MRRIVLWWRGLSTGPRRALAVLAWLVAMTAIYIPVLLVMGLLFDDPEWWERLPQFLAISAVGTWATWWRERGQTIGERDRRQAVKRGALPAGADPAEWREALLRDRRTTVRARQIGMGAVAVLAAGWIAVLLVTDLGAIGWILLVAVLALGAVLPWANRRQLRRIDALLDVMTR